MNINSKNIWWLALLIIFLVPQLAHAHGQVAGVFNDSSLIALPLMVIFNIFLKEFSIKTYSPTKKPTKWRLAIGTAILEAAIVLLLCFPFRRDIFGIAIPVFILISVLMNLMMLGKVKDPNPWHSLLITFKSMIVYFTAIWIISMIILFSGISE